MIRLPHVMLALLFIILSQSAEAVDIKTGAEKPPSPGSSIRGPINYKECINMPSTVLSKFLPGKGTRAKKCRERFPLPASKP